MEDFPIRSQFSPVFRGFFPSLACQDPRSAGCCGKQRFAHRALDNTLLSSQFSKPPVLTLPEGSGRKGSHRDPG